MKHDKTGQGDHKVPPMHTHCRSYVLFFEKKCLQGCVPACLHHPPCLSAPHPYHPNITLSIQDWLARGPVVTGQQVAKAGDSLPTLMTVQPQRRPWRGEPAAQSHSGQSRAEAPTRAAAVTGKGKPGQSLSSQEKKMRPEWLPRARSLGDLHQQESPAPTAGTVLGFS